MKYTLLLVSTIALFISAAQAAPEPNNNMPGTGKKDAEIEGLMKRLKEDLAEAQNTGEDGGSIESFAGTRCEGGAPKDHGSRSPK